MGIVSVLYKDSFLITNSLHTRFLFFKTIKLSFFLKNKMIKSFRVIDYKKIDFYYIKY